MYHYKKVGVNMLSYNPLWKLLIDKGMNKVQLRDLIGISPATLSRMSKNENVNMEVLNKICDKLDCKIEQVIEFSKEN